MRWLQQDGDLDIRELHLVNRPPEQLGDALVLGRRHVLGCRELRLDDDVVGVCRPGKIMDVGLLEGVRLRAVAVRALALLHARGAEDVVARHGDVDGVAAEVRIELGGGVELVAVPSARFAAPHAGRLVDAELREPLADQVEVVLVPRPGEHLRQLRRKRHLEGDGPARRHGFRQCGLDHRLIVLVPIVGLDERERGLEVRAGGRPD